MAGVPMRSNANRMSLDVISRFSGGPNLMPFLRWNVYVLPPFVIMPVFVARSGTITLPGAPATWL